MTIQEITSESQWNEFMALQKPNTFLQSWEWGQVQKRLGEDIWYLGLFKNAEQIGAALVVGVKARRGNFLLIPHGPILKHVEDIGIALKQLSAYAREKLKSNNVALRIAPLVATSETITNTFTNHGFRPAPLHIHAELTWVLDISKSPEELLSGMRKTTRHAIRKAEQQDITVEILTGQEGLQRFWPLYEQTTSRHGFVPFTREVITTQVEEFSRTNRTYMAMATYEGKDVAGAIMIQYGNTMFYYHGASQKLSSNIPAAHLLHWRSIEYAKQQGATQYNFWGIAPENEPNHPFRGITVFKQGFGGYAIAYVHVQDVPLSLSYWKLWTVEMIRKMRRGF